MKYILMILIAIITILIALFVKGQFKNEPTVKIGDAYFKAEIAKTDDQKKIGLSKYKKIENDFVMVFPFGNSDYYTFWMKGMKFPIDIIYTQKNKIVDIFPNVQAPKNDNDILQIIRPNAKADTVLEINAGVSKKNKFKKGDLIKISY